MVTSHFFHLLSLLGSLEVCSLGQPWVSFNCSPWFLPVIKLLLVVEPNRGNWIPPWPQVCEHAVHVVHPESWQLTTHSTRQGILILWGFSRFRCGCNEAHPQYQTRSLFFYGQECPLFCNKQPFYSVVGEQTSTVLEIGRHRNDCCYFTGDIG